MVSFNAVYTKVVDKVKTQYATIFHSAKYIPVVPKSPAIFVREIGNYDLPNSIDFSASDKACRMTVEVQVMSNKSNGSIAEVNSIQSLINESMKSMHFRRTMQEPLDLTDKTGTRIVARYERNFGDDDTI